MSNHEFASMLKLLISSLLQLIEENKSLLPQEAADLLYSSQLYGKLEQDDTKLWHLSAHALYDLLEEEITAGKITYPEEA
jgi:hypothetical protein